MLFLLRFVCRKRILKPKWFVASTINSTGCSFFGKRSFVVCSASLLILYKETALEVIANDANVVTSTAISSNFFMVLFSVRYYNFFFFHFLVCFHFAFTLHYKQKTISTISRSHKGRKK